MRKKVITLSSLFALLICCFIGVNAYADEPFDISAAEVKTTYASYDYRFKEIKPIVTVTVVKEGESVKLDSKTDYTVEYSDNINAGTATVTVTGTGGYTGCATGNFTIRPLKITEKGFSYTNTVKAYPGSAPQYSVQYKKTELALDTDYTVTSTGYDKCGYKVAEVKIKGIGNFRGTKTIKASVYPDRVTGIKYKKTGASEIKFKWKSLENEGIKNYRIYLVDKKGKVIKTFKDVKTNSAVLSDLERGKVYNFKIRAYVTKNGKTLYSDFSKKVSCFTRPEKVTLNYACRGAKYKINAGWDEISCSGYQIKYSTDKKFKKNVKYAYAGSLKTSKKIKVKKAGKPYYVKIRAYTKFNGEKKFGKWSRKFTTEFGKLYEYYSTYYVNNPNRTTNLKLACKAIDGTIIYPGETFSFNEVVGIRTASKGYKPAPIFTGTTGHEDGVGGGVCQVASTMFNAALYCNFAIVERHQHSQRVVYCPLGRDAAIFWGSEDFKFRNTSDFPIRINMICEGGKLTCKIYTNGYKKPPKVKLEVDRSGNHFTLHRYVNGKSNYTTRSTY
ncbi:MAG: VanW family protein [Eubacterium sp.]|nr:VanW family protein [Eubacterium sp.]